MTGGAGAFNKAASASYASLSSEKMDELKQSSANSLETATTDMTSKDVIKAGTKIFKKIQLQVCVHSSISYVSIYNSYYV